VKGAVRIDLSTLDGHDLTRAVQSAAYAPAGAEVTFTVGPKQWPDHWALDYLRDNGTHLRSVLFESSEPTTIHAWVAAARGVDETPKVAEFPLEGAA
jgi:hypothetical protein